MLRWLYAKAKAKTKITVLDLFAQLMTVNSATLSAVGFLSVVCFPSNGFLRHDIASVKKNMLCGLLIFC